MGEQQKPVSALSAASLIEQFTQDPEELIEIKLRGGVVLKARPLVEAREMAELTKSSQSFLKVATKNPPPEWKPFLPVTDDVVRMVVFTAALMVDPPFTQLEALQLAKQSGPVLAHIYGAIAAQSVVNIAETETEAWDAAGEESRATSSGETTSPSPEMSTENTPAS